MKLLVLPALLAAFAAVPASASALTIGISENNPGMFTDPLFTNLGVKHTRVVVSYNVLEAAARGDDEINRVQNYIDAATASGITPLVTFEHARGAAELCSGDRSLPQCQLPTPAEYEANFRAFRARFPQVTVYAPWNEANHFTQPTARNPKAAARFTDIAARNCRGCKIVVADILDQADSTKAKNPKFKSLTRWTTRFRKALKTRRNICGIHNYSDTNRFRDKGTKAIIKAAKCKEYWLTETGGIAKFASFKFDLQRQLRATKYMFKVARRQRKIKRVYVYTWFGNVTPRFDAGLVADGAPRPSYNEVSRQLDR